MKDNFEDSKINFFFNLKINSKVNFFREDKKLTFRQEIV